MTWELVAQIVTLVLCAGCPLAITIGAIVAQFKPVPRAVAPPSKPNPSRNAH